MSAFAAQNGFVGRPVARAPGRPAPFTWTVSAAAAVGAEPAKAEVTVYGYIGEAYDWNGQELGGSAQKFLDEVRAIPDLANTELTIRVNSGGGDAFTGSAIYTVLSTLTAKLKTVIIDGVAASAASVIAMAADRILMPRNALMMIHNASTWFHGTRADLAKADEMLERLGAAMVSAYSAKNSKKTPEEIAALMAAETWMTAEEAVELGFADEIIEAVPASALVHDLSTIPSSKIPEALVAAQVAAVVEDDLEAQIAAAVAQAQAEATAAAAAAAETIPEPVVVDPEAEKKAKEEAAAKVAADAATAADALVRSKIRATAATYGIEPAFRTLEEQLTPLAEASAVTAKLREFVFEASVAAALKTEVTSAPAPELPSQRTSAAAITHQVVADVYAARRKTLQGDT